MRSHRRIRSCAAALRTARAIVCTAAALAAGGGCSALGNVPPFHEVERDLPGGAEVERAAFGLVESERRPDGSTWAAIRPLLVEHAEPYRPDVLEILPPFGSYVRSDVRRRWAVWPVFASDSLGTDAERARGESDDDTMLLPLLGWGSEPGQDDWWMVFPIYGDLRQKFVADELEFVAFPAYVRTRSGDWRSTHVLWPLIAWGEGEGRTHARFLPFWSQSDGPSGSRRTAAWPLVHWNTQRHGDRTFDGWFVFPLAGRRTSQDGSFEETTLLWPFFEWSDDARNGDRYRGILWPFHKTRESPSAKTSSTWWWPVHGDFESPEETSEFWAWPLWWEAEYRGERRTKRHAMLVPFWMTREDGPKGAPPDHEEIRAWPFFSWERHADGLEELRAPEVVPFFGWRSGERTWGDLLALFRWRADREGRVAWDGPLGGIVRWRRTAAGARTLTLLWGIDLPLGGGE